MIHYSALLVVLVLAFMAGCSSFSDRACTLIGCDDGLSLRLIDAPMDPFSLEIEEEGGETYLFECGTRHHCDAGIFVSGVSADSVTVRVTVNDTVIERSVDLTYENVQPNGPDCPPICRQATVEIKL